MPVLNLDTADARVSRAGRANIDTNATNVEATLTATAAAALNEAFNTTLFKGGLKIGTVAVRSNAAEIEVVQGATSLTLAPAAGQALQSLGVTPGVVAPATAGSNGSLTFPIVSPKIGLVSFAQGEIAHAGGIALTKGSTTVSLTDFSISGDSDGLTLTASVGGQRVAILSLDASGARFALDAGTRTITASGLDAQLTAAAASALNQAFGTSAFTAGLSLGDVTATTQGR